MVRDGCPIVALALFIVNVALGFVVLQELFSIPELPGLIWALVPGCH